MTITKSFASKAVVAFLAAAMVVTMFAPSAKAQSSEDLQAMINNLLAQIAALQSQVGQGASSVASGVCPYTWTRDLNMGSTGADVMKLQQFLNADLDTRVSASGAGSVGAETEYYGPATAAAVSKMQVKYRAEVLSPAGLVNPTGFFGPSSRAKANAVCVAAPVVVPPVVVDPGTPGTPSTPTTLRGEATLDEFTVDEADEDQVEEGASDAPVAEVTVVFEDGDAEISRMDVSFDKSGRDPWDVLDTVSLWVDGDMVAEMDAADEDDYQDEDAGTLRFSGLSLVGMEDEDLDIVIAVSLQNNIDSGDQGNWNVSVDSIRYFDADGVAETDDEFEDIGDNVVFEIVEAGEDDEIRVRTSTSDPDATTIALIDGEVSSWTTFFAFDLDTEDSKSDLELNEVPVTVVVANDTFGDVVSDLQLVIDGQEFDDWSYATGTSASNTVVVVFDIDGDYTIDAGDRVTVQLQAEFKDLAVEGATIQGSVTSNNAENIDAEGVEDVDTLSGAATGDVHTLRTNGAVLKLVSVSETSVLNSDATTTDDSGTFVVKFSVTAFEEDLYINKTAASGTANGTDGVNYQVTNGSGALVSVGTPTQSLSSNAQSESTQFVVYEGQSRDFTLTVSLNPDTTGFYGVRLYSLNFNDTLGANPDVWQLAVPIEDYETDPLEIKN